MKKYELRLEIAGPAAIFTRADSGGTPISYPVPTFSACKGIMECIAFLKQGASICPTQVEICKRKASTGGEVRFQQYTSNYGGPLRKSSQIRKGASFQLNAHILIDVCYRIHAEIVSDTVSETRGNSRHYLMDLFNRRLRQGRCHRTPCLGWSEFTASYWGVFRDEYEVDEAIDGVRIASMLTKVWDAGVDGSYAPSFQQNVQIKKGVLNFA